MSRKTIVLLSAIFSASALALAGADGVAPSPAAGSIEVKAPPLPPATQQADAPGKKAKAPATQQADAPAAKTRSGEKEKGVDASVDIMQRLITEWDAGEMDESDGVPMEDLSFPVDHFDDGTVRAQFFAKWALMPNDQNAFVRAKGVVIELYDEQGRMNGYYRAEKCIYDRATQTGYSEGKVRMEYHAPDRNIRIDGYDMQWNLATRNAKILREPVVVMSEIMGQLGGAFRK